MKYTTRRRTMSDEAVATLYESGIDALTVGYHAGCSETTVRKIVRAHGGTVRSKGAVKKRKDQ